MQYYVPWYILLCTARCVYSYAQPGTQYIYIMLHHARVSGPANGTYSRRRDRPDCQKNTETILLESHIARNYTGIPLEYRDKRSSFSW